MIFGRTYRSVRAQALHYLARPHASIPTGPIGGPAAWRPADFGDDGEWIEHLDDRAVAELEGALARAPQKLDRIGAAPLPTLAPRIRRWREVINEGRGFVLVRGVPVARWSRPDVERAFWIIGQHLGRPGAQNGDGDLLGHVRDQRLGRDGEVRQYKTAEAIGFHCDAADAVGLLCLRPALRGGLSRIASSVSVFDRIVELRPDLAARLFESWFYDSRGDGGTDVFRARLAAHFGGRISTFYHSEYLRTASRYPGVPALDAEKLELLDLYDELAGSPEQVLEMELLPGDIQLCSNHTIVHARTAYVDADDPDQRRHLLRLWLTTETPRSMAERIRRVAAAGELVAGLTRRRLRRARMSVAVRG